jgi:hypothetical protein
MAPTTCSKSVYFATSAIAVLALAGCGTPNPRSSPGGAPTGSIIGRVTAGPTCPVERIGHPCAPRPVVAEVRVLADGRVVAATRSDGHGTYRFDLSAGSYIVVAVTSDLYPRCTPRTVTVRSAQTTRGDIDCDTGIR